MTNLIEHYKTLPKVEQKKLNAEYYEWVSHLPCCLSGSQLVGRPHHLRYAGYCGVGQKPPHVFCVPITYINHTLIHTKGIKAVEKMYGVNVVEILNELHERFISEILKGKL